MLLAVIAVPTDNVPGAANDGALALLFDIRTFPEPAPSINVAAYPFAAEPRETNLKAFAALPPKLEPVPP